MENFTYQYLMLKMILLPPFQGDFQSDNEEVYFQRYPLKILDQFQTVFELSCFYHPLSYKINTEMLSNTN